MQPFSGIWSGRQSKGYHFSSSVFLSVTALAYTISQTHASYLQFHSILQGCLPSARQAAPIVWPSCLIAAPTPPLAVFSYVLLVTWFSAERQTETLTARGACLMEPHSEEKIANKQ